MSQTYCCDVILYLQKCEGNDGGESSNRHLSEVVIATRVRKCYLNASVNVSVNASATFLSWCGLRFASGPVAKEVCTTKHG